MTSRTFLFLLVVAVMSVLTAAVIVVNRSALDSPEDSGMVLFPVLADRTEDVARLIIHSATDTLTIERSDIGWRLRERDNYPVDVTKVREAVMAMVHAVLLEPKTVKSERHVLLEVADQDDGIKSSGSVFTLQDINGVTLAALIVGKRCVGSRDADDANEMVYVRRPDENQVWLARISPMLPTAEVRRWVSPTVVAIDSARIMQVTLHHPDGQVLTVMRTGDSDSIVVQPLPVNAKINEVATQRIFTVLSSILLEDVRAVVPGMVLPSKVIQVTAVTDNGLRVSIIMYDGGENEAWLTVSADGSAATSKPFEARAEARILNEHTSGWLYRIPSYTAAIFRSRHDDLLVKTGEEPKREE